MVIVHSYVKLPEGMVYHDFPLLKPRFRSHVQRHVQTCYHGVTEIQKSRAFHSESAHDWTKLLRG